MIDFSTKKFRENSVSKNTDEKKTAGKNKLKKILSRTHSVQKRSTIGAEVEFFIINKNGKIVNFADKILSQVDNNGNDYGITKEAGENMIEVGCYPNLEGIDSLQSLAFNLESLLYIADQQKVSVCPLGTYPGSFNPKIRQHGHYKTEENLFGRNVYKQAARCCGMHIHYALPWGVFDFKKLKLKKRIKSKHKESLVNCYNFLIAADPGLSVFAQSSPFFQGKLVGKDARALAWRGDRDIGFSPSLYNIFPEYGELPRYQHTGTDLVNFTEKMFQQWKYILENNGVPESKHPDYKSILEANWTPLRVSYHGTLEMRGTDINTPLILLAVSQIIQNILRIIQDNFIRVEVSDVAIDEPFKYSGDKILIPPFTYIKTDLQPAAFYKGFDDDRIYRYCKRLLWLAKELGNKDDNDIFSPLDEMIDSKKTVSDRIISQARKLGYKDMSKKLPNELAAQIALFYSNKLFKEMVLFRELVKIKNGK